VPLLPASAGLAGDANALAVSLSRCLEMLLAQRELLYQQCKNLKEERLIPMLFLINKPQLLCRTKSKPGV